jgi:DNA polymerase-1
MIADLNSIFHKLHFEEDSPTLSYNSRVLLVDATNLFIRSYAAVPSMDEDGRHVGGMVGFLKSLGFAIKTFRPSRVIVVFDGRGGSLRRRKLYPEYKKNRKPPIRLNRQYDMTTDEQEAQNMKFQLVTLVELLDCLPVTVFAMDLVEADDVIAYLSQLVTEVGGSSIIYSTDKDFFQLAADNVKIHNPVKKKTYTVDSIVEEYSIHPKHFHFFRALDGDVSDNINGVRGVGEKSLLKYLPEIINPDENISIDFIKQKYTGVKKIPKMISNIIDSEDIVNRNLELMNLHIGIISGDARLKIIDRFKNSSVQFDKYDLTKKMISYKLLSTFPSYDTWVSQIFLPLNRFHT